LGIIGTPDVPGIDPPVLDGRALSCYNVEVGWARDGHDGIRFRGQRGAETAWTDLGTDMNPPFVDARADLRLCRRARLAALRQGACHRES